MSAIESSILTQTSSLDDQTIERYSAELYRGVSAENNMMHPSIETIFNAFKAGRAVFYVSQETNQAVGCCRMIESIPQSVLAQLNLIGRIPSIFELGTVYVNPFFRGRGISTNLVNGIAQENLQRFLSGEELLLGTTTSLIMLNSLRPSTNLGIQFLTGSTSSLDYIEAVTCMCNPSEPLGGTGTHISDSCGQRSTIFPTNELITVQEAENVEGIAKDKGCKLFVSDLELSNRTNTILRTACAEAGISRRMFSIMLRGEG